MDKKEMQAVAELMMQSSNTLVLTGAGMSTESGLQDFRSAKGMWADKDPIQMASREAMNSNYGEFHQFYQDRLQALEKAGPHQGHNILARWEKKGWIKGILTQNVDGFHTAAGSQKVWELHGSLSRIICCDCGDQGSLSAFREKQPCQECGGLLRPGVVLFGEGLPQKEWKEAMDHLEEADLLLIIGTSLEVAPVNQIPLTFKDRGPMVLINKGSVPWPQLFKIHLQGAAGEILDRIDKILSGTD